MEIKQLYDALVNVRTLHGAKLPIGIQVNEDEVFLLEKASVIFRVDEQQNRVAHILLLKPVAFRLSGASGELPCAHLDKMANELALVENSGPFYYTSAFCPDCGVKLNSAAPKKDITPL